VKQAAPTEQGSLPLEGSEAHGAVVNDNPGDCQSRFCNNRRSRKDRREASIFGRQTVTMKYAFLYSVCNRTPQGRQGGATES
ncbi:MAG: hypothetical protein IKI03_04690, partial [Clostridia bacterium]|nr:hypothetical protein [Clostridia bacterium]